MAPYIVITLVCLCFGATAGFYLRSSNLKSFYALAVAAALFAGIFAGGFPQLNFVVYMVVAVLALLVGMVVALLWGDPWKNFYRKLLAVMSST